MKAFRTLMALAICLALAGAALGGPPAFEATIDITGDLVIAPGETTTLTAAWSTNRDVTRYEWTVTDEADNIVVGTAAISFDGASAGSFPFSFTSLVAGQYVVSFSIWHHNQSDRDASASVTVTVVDEECPAAPAIANAYLDSLAFTEGRGDIIRAVTEEMSPGNMFHGYSKCDPQYADEVIAFVDWLLSL